MIKVVKWVVRVLLGNVDVMDEELMMMLVFIGVDVLLNLWFFIYQLVNFDDDVLLILNYFLIVYISD